MKQYITGSEKETRNLGKKHASYLHGVIALSGELGAGKTTFVQGFGKGLGIKEKIISPTFVLVRQYQIPNTIKLLYHIDLYRLENRKQIKQLGFEETLSDLNHLIIIEWAEKAKRFLPKGTTYINFKSLGETKRKITIGSSPF